jgi:hypothetical protein
MAPRNLPIAEVIFSLGIAGAALACLAMANRQWTPLAAEGIAVVCTFCMLMAFLVSSMPRHAFWAAALTIAVFLPMFSYDGYSPVTLLVDYLIAWFMKRPAWHSELFTSSRAPSLLAVLDGLMAPLMSISFGWIGFALAYWRANTCPPLKPHSRRWSLTLREVFAILTICSIIAAMVWYRSRFVSTVMTMGVIMALVACYAGRFLRPITCGSFLAGALAAAIILNARRSAFTYQLSALLAGYLFSELSIAKGSGIARMEHLVFSVMILLTALSVSMCASRVRKEQESPGSSVVPP